MEIPCEVEIGFTHGALDQEGNNYIKAEHFIIWASNADGFTRQKILELKYIINMEKDPPHIIAISEVKPKYHKGYITIPEYQL